MRASALDRPRRRVCSRPCASGLLAPRWRLRVALACRQEPDAPAAAPAAPAATAARRGPPQRSPLRPSQRHARSDRCPRFSGWTLDDQRFDVASLLGQRLLLFFFNPEVQRGGRSSRRPSQPIAALRGKHNFQIVGDRHRLEPRDAPRRSRKQPGLRLPDRRRFERRDRPEARPARARRAARRRCRGLRDLRAGPVRHRRARAPRPRSRSRSARRCGSPRSRRDRRADARQPAARPELPGADARRQGELRPRRPARQAR